jgi:hypothetical protein
MKPKLKAKLEALSTIQNRAASKIIEDSLERYILALPVKDREAIELLASRVKR